MTKGVGNIGSLVISVIRWLENTDEDEKWWQLQTQVVQLCILELQMLLKAEHRARPAGEAPLDAPLDNVILKLRDMVNAMQSRNRAAALESGRESWEILSRLE